MQNMAEAVEEEAELATATTGEVLFMEQAAVAEEEM